MNTILKIALIAGVILTSACAKRTPVVTGPPQSASSAGDDRILYERGLAAFRESTPEGYARAAEFFQRAAAIVPGNCDYALNFAQANLFLALEQEENLDDFTAALANSSTPACGLNTPFGRRLEAFRALPEFQLGKNPSTANELIDQTSKSEPGNPLDWYVAWRLRPAQRLTSQLYDGLKAADAEPNLALTYYELGNYWNLRNRQAEARWAFEHAIAASPRHFRSYIGLAEVISDLAPDQDVEPLYRRAVEVAPTFLQGRMILGDYLAFSGQNDLATEQYLAAVEHNPRFESGYLGLASNYLDLENVDEAEKTSLKALEINPRSYKAFYYLGNVWYARHDLIKAEQAFQESLKIVPSFSDAAYGLGTVLWEKGQIEPALAQFDNVVRYNPGYAAAWLSRSAVRANRHEFHEALLDSTQALKLYNKELEDITKDIERAEKRGVLRRADAQRKKKERIDFAISQAQRIKTDAETQTLNK